MKLEGKKIVGCLMEKSLVQSYVLLSSLDLSRSLNLNWGELSTGSTCDVFDPPSSTQRDRQ